MHIPCRPGIPHAHACERMRARTHSFGCNPVCAHTHTEWRCKCKHTGVFTHFLSCTHANTCAHKHSHARARTCTSPRAGSISRACVLYCACSGEHPSMLWCRHVAWRVACERKRDWWNGHVGVDVQSDGTVRWHIHMVESHDAIWPCTRVAHLHDHSRS